MRAFTAVFVFTVTIDFHTPHFGFPIVAIAINLNILLQHAAECLQVSLVVLFFSFTDLFYFCSSKNNLLQLYKSFSSSFRLKKNFNSVSVIVLNSNEFQFSFCPSSKHEMSFNSVLVLMLGLEFVFSSSIRQKNSFSSVLVIVPNLYFLVLFRALKLNAWYRN